MSQGEVSVNISYFGKLPSRSDFVKASDNHQLVSVLDRWAAEGLALMAQDLDWKTAYDAAMPMNFAFLGSRSHHAIAGQFTPSRDASDRRFPFLSAARLEVPQPLAFIGRSPLALTRLWARLERLNRIAVEAGNAYIPLREINEVPIAVNLDARAYDPSYNDFMEIQTIGALQALLQDAGHTVSIQRLLPALGILLQPVLSSGAAQLDKCLELPLPRDLLYRPLIASFWLDLISGFLARADFELAIFLGDITAPKLVIGFNGAHGGTLQGVLDPQVASTQNIRLDDPDWVDEHINDDYGVKKLSSALEQATLSLQSARRTFRETFLGG